jgi:hypothetical protein
LRKELNDARGSAAGLGDGMTDAMEGLTNPFESGRKLIDQWKNDLATLGMDAKDKQLFDLEELFPKFGPGSDIGRDIIGGLRDTLGGIKDKTFADELTKQFADPIDQAADRILKIRESLNKELISQDIASQAEADVLGGEEVPDSSPARYSAAMERGSAAAQQAIYLAGRDTPTTTDKEQLKQLRRQTEILQRVDSKMGAEETVSIPST